MKKKAENKKIPKRIATFVCAVLCLATVMSVCALSLVSCSDKWSGESAYVQVSKGGESITARIPVGKDVDSKDVFLFGINIWESGADLSGAQPLTEAKIKGDEARAEIDVGGKLSEMLCKGYLFAKKEASGAYTPITGVYYVTNPRDSEKKVKGDEDSFPSNMKGAIGTVSQLLDLGASATAVTVNISELMSAEGGAGTVPYVWNGLTYYADRDALEALDKQIRDHTDAGIYVYLEIVQTTPAEELPERIKPIAFDAPAGKQGYALNMTNREGASRICGMLDLLAGRYGSGGENGKASAFIIGRNVNNMSDWYAGSEGESAVLNYARAVRAAYNILLSHTPSGRVYVSMGNNWNVADTGDLTVRDMMISFNNQVGTEGDFFWQMAVEANASDTSDSSIWDDPGAAGRSDFISPANIETVTNQLSTEMYKCGGKQRHVLLNRFFVGGTDENARAASYAYAYYKCLYAETVDGLLYGDVSDAGAGLLGDGKKIAEVVTTIDDKNCTDLSFVSSLVGDKWDRIYKKHSKNADVRVTVYSSGGSDHSNDGASTVTDFSGGDIFGFKPAASSEYVELRYSDEKNRPALYAPLSPKGESDKAGVISSSLERKTLKEAGYLGITAKIDSPGSNAIVTLRLSGYDKKGTEYVFVGETAVNTNVWTDVYFDIEDFIDDIDGDTVTVAVTVCPKDGGGAADGLWLSEIVTEEPMKGGFPVWLIVVLISAAVIGGCTAFVMWFRKNYTFVRE